MPPDDLFLELFPTMTRADLAKRYGVHQKTIGCWAKTLGIKKSHEYLSSLHRLDRLGRINSQEARAKISKKAMGRIVSEESKAKAIATKTANGTTGRGEFHHNWKGGRPWERFKTPDYISWRNAVMIRDSYTCQDCGRKCKKHEKGLAAHHIKDYANFPRLRLEVNNGLTLCRKCHMTRHSRAPAEMEMIECSCGCGGFIKPIDIYGRPRKFANGHSRRTFTQEQITSIRASTERAGKLAALYSVSRQYIWRIQKGDPPTIKAQRRKKTSEHKRKLSLAHKGMTASSETRKKMSMAQKARYAK